MVLLCAAIGFAAACDMSAESDLVEKKRAMQEKTRGDAAEAYSSDLNVSLAGMVSEVERVVQEHPSLWRYEHAARLEYAGWLSRFDQTTYRDVVGQYRAAYDLACERDACDYFENGVAVHAIAGIAWSHDDCDQVLWALERIREHEEQFLFTANNEGQEHYCSGPPYVDPNETEQ